MLIIFAVHLIVFSRLLVLRGKRYLAPTISFVLLVAAYGVRIVAPDARFMEYNVSQTLRFVAWIALGMSVLR